MSEEPGIYNTDTADAMEMLGKGYDHPAVTIEPPSVAMELRGREFREVEKPAFVKISTGFKVRLKEVDEIALKVWLFIALSVNRYSGRANPGLRTISEETGLAINTIRAAIERLEKKYDLLTVNREERRYNIYEPRAFVSANRSEPVSPDDTDAQTVSVEGQSVSVEGQSVSARVILNQSNKSNQIGGNPKKKGDILDGMIALSQEHRPELEMRERFEKALSLSPDWDRHAPRDSWERFDAWLVEKALAGQPIELWAKWWKADPFRAKRTIDLTPDKIRTGWLQAFVPHLSPQDEGEPM
jgi:hypothetical protein